MKGCSVDLKAMITGETTVDGVPHSAELLRFVDAVLAEPNGETGTAPASEELANARTTLRRVLSDAAFVDACATVASFNAVVVVADGTGIPLEQQKAEKTEQMREELQIDQLRDHGRFDS